MSFFQVDDAFYSNRKVRRMVEDEGFTKAAVAVALWTLTGSLARQAGFDGEITLGAATSVTLDRLAARKGAALLVTYGLWHAPGHDCEVCPQPAEGSWVFHQWFQFNYGTGEQERVKRAKLRELKTPAVTEPVWARDRGADGKHRCRYCGKVVHRPSQQKGGDRRSKDIATLDHVDPTKALGSSNIVVACWDCNRRKAQRTPEQAEMTLLPPPLRAVADQSEINPAINPESIREVCPPRARGRARARAGAGGVGDGEVVGVGPGSQPPIDHGSIPAPGRAGAAPPVAVAASWPTSPWTGHTGPPPPDDVIAASTCPDHHEPMPCRFCLRRGAG